MNLIFTGITGAYMYVNPTIKKIIIKQIEKKMNIMKANGSNCDDLIKQLDRWQNDTSTNSDTLGKIRNKTIDNFDSHRFNRGRLLLY